jgi:hypothetical protein
VVFIDAVPEGTGNPRGRWSAKQGLLVKTKRAKVSFYSGGGISVTIL